MGGGAGHLANDSGALAQWLELGGVTAFGFLVLAVVSAAVGYLVSGFIWRFVVAGKRAARLRRMERRLDERLAEGGE